MKRIISIIMIELFVFILAFNSLVFADDDLFIEEEKGSELALVDKQDKKFSDLEFKITEADYFGGTEWEPYLYSYTITNNSDNDMKKYCALVSYFPKTILMGKKVKEETFLGQVHPFDIDLKKGEIITGTFTSNIYGISGANLIWIEFDNEEEKNDFLDDPVLTKKINNKYDIVKRLGIRWMKDKFNINITASWQ